MSNQSHVVLLGVPKNQGVPSSSGFCQKLETFLRFSGISYELRDTYPYKAPKGKVPYAEITHDGRTVTVPDSHFIIQYLVEHDLIKDPDDLASLTPAQKAESRAFQAYVEETLYAAIVYDRWLIDENVATTTKEIFGNAPWAVRSALSWFFRRRITNLLWYAGMGRHSPEEVKSLQKEAFEALEVKFKEHRFFHSDEKPSRIDLTVYGFLANILATEGNPLFANMVLESAALTAFVKHMTNWLFPEYKALLQKLEK
ncbi:hypothetical protein F5I97DRAFT_1468363 [Phlebopus sp. FC_14]|nr:hypothetical protein F5I97DRAFT_1468363 [Phlebopus sp. FC_14]